MIARVIGLVGARRDAMADGPALGFQHRLGGAAFRPAIGRRDHARHRKPVPVLHGDMAEVAELCLARDAFMDFTCTFDAILQFRAQWGKSFVIVKTPVRFRYVTTRPPKLTCCPTE